MGLLVEGKWVDQWYDTKSTGGKFVRQASSFRHTIGDEGFPAQANRYHLYVSYACPWAHRAIIFRKLKNLESIIGMTVVDPLMAENGWVLPEDPVNGKSFLHEVYTLADARYSGRVTVPVLWDKVQQTIVNNESAEIIRMMNGAFNQITGNLFDYYPEALREAIDETNAFVYDRINNGVYKAGFATKQSVYERAVQSLFDALDILESRLAKQRYLVGDVITEADWRLFTTLLRFDPVYVGHFKCNLRRLIDYTNLWGYLCDLYQVEGVKETVHMDHIKTHYYTSHAAINPNGIVALGPIMDLDAPHDRSRFDMEAE